MATSVGLNFRLTAAVESFEKSMADVNRKLGQIDKSSRATASGMKLLAGIEVGKLLVGGLTRVAGAFRSAASSATQFFNSARAEIDALGKLATQIGIAVEPLQVFQRVAEHAGVSTATLEKSLQTMTKRLGEAAMGTGPAAVALKQLGLNIKDLDKMTPDRQFVAIAQALSAIPSQTQKAAMAFAIFGRDGVKMLPMFDRLEEQVREVANESARLALTLSEKQVRNVEKMNDRFTDVWNTIKGIGNQVVSNLAEPIKSLLDDFIKFVENYKSFTSGKTGGFGIAEDITKVFLDAAVVLGNWADMAIDGLMTFYDLFKALIEKLLKFFVDYFGADEYMSPGANEANERIREIDDQLEVLERNMRIVADRADTWMDPFGLNAEAAKDYEKRIALLQSQREDALKNIIDSEERHLEERRTQNGVLDSIGDRMRAFRDGVPDAGGPRPRPGPPGRPFNPRFPDFPGAAPNPNDLGMDDPNLDPFSHDEFGDHHATISEQTAQTSLLRTIADNSRLQPVTIG